MKRKEHNKSRSKSQRQCKLKKSVLNRIYLNIFFKEVFTCSTIFNPYIYICRQQRYLYLEQHLGCHKVYVRLDKWYVTCDILQSSRITISLVGFYKGLHSPGGFILESSSTYTICSDGLKPRFQDCQPVSDGLSTCLTPGDPCSGNWLLRCGVERIIC